MPSLMKFYCILRMQFRFTSTPPPPPTSGTLFEKHKLHIINNTRRKDLFSLILPLIVNLPQLTLTFGSAFEVTIV